jgi:hypothetical protein
MAMAMPAPMAATDLLQFDGILGRDCWDGPDHRGLRRRKAHSADGHGAGHKDGNETSHGMPPCQLAFLRPALERRCHPDPLGPMITFSQFAVCSGKTGDAFSLT